MKNPSSLVYSLPVISVLWITHFFIDFCTGIFPVYKTLAGFDITQAALVAGLCGFFGEISQLIFGRIGDRGNRKLMIIAGLVLTSCAYLLPFCHSLNTAWILVFLIMLGSSCFHPNAAGLAGLSSKDNKNSVLAFFASGGALGLALSQITFSSIFSSYRFLVLIFFLPLIFVIYKTYKFPFFDPPSSDKKTKFFEIIFNQLLKEKTLVFLYLAQICNYGFMFALIFYLPEALKTKNSCEWLWRGGGHLLLISGNGLILPFLGKLCSKIGHYKVLSSLGFLGIALFTAFLSFPHISTFAMCSLLFLMGATFGSMNPISVSWGLKISPDHPSSVAALLMGLAWGVADLFTAFSGLFNRFFPEYGIKITFISMSLLFTVGMYLVRLIGFYDKEKASILESSEKGEF